MKKKLVVLALLMAFVMSCTACGGGIVGMLSKDDKEPASNPVQDEIDDVEIEEEIEEVEEEEEEEEETTKPSGTVNTPSELSDDIYSFQVSIDGTVYQFPMWASDFAALGWEFDGTPDGTLASYEYTVAETWVKDNVEVYTTLANLTMNTLTYEDAMVAGIEFDKWNMEDCDWEIILPKGVQYGVSTRDDIIAAWGDPTSEYDGSMYYNMTYEYDSYQEIDLYVYKDTGVLQEIEIRNMIELEGGDNTVDPTVPEAVKNYQAPTELGDDLYVYNIEIEGNLYTLPFPVSALLDNGFTIKESGSNMEIGAGSYGWVELVYNNQSFSCIVDNYADYATIAENCFITSFESDEYFSNFDVTIPGGLKRGDSEKTLLDVIKNFNYEVETSGDYTYYSIYKPDDEYGSKFDIRVKEGVIVGIEVEYDD